MRKLLILGSTGSIGRQALDVVRDSDDLEVVGLTAAESWERLLAQAVELDVTRVALSDAAAGARAGRAWHGGELLAGTEGIDQLIAGSGAAPLLSGLGGSAGVDPAVATLTAGIDL